MPNFSNLSSRPSAYIFILDPKVLEDIVKDPDSPNTEILRIGFFYRRLARVKLLAITTELLQDLAKHYTTKSEGEVEEVEIDGKKILVIKKYSTSMTIISTACEVEELPPNEAPKNITDATLSLITRRKLDTKEVTVISDGNTPLTTQLTKLGINVNIVSTAVAIDKLQKIFETCSDTTF